MILSIRCPLQETMIVNCFDVNMKVKNHISTSLYIACNNRCEKRRIMFTLNDNIYELHGRYHHYFIPIHTICIIRRIINDINNDIIICNIGIEYEYNDIKGLIQFDSMKPVKLRRALSTIKDVPILRCAIQFSIVTRNDRNMLLLEYCVHTI